MSHCPSCNAEMNQSAGKLPGEISRQSSALRRTLAERPGFVSDASDGQLVDSPSEKAACVYRDKQTAKLMRPLNRPPMAILCALDDGSVDSGEIWRIRQPQFVIGRSRGDALIAHDRDMSAQHAEISYRWHNGHYQWQLSDLDSTNGLFIRVSRSVLRCGRQLIIGSRRYEFLDAQHQLASLEDADGADASVRRTRHYQQPSTRLLAPATARFVEINPSGRTREIQLPDEGGWIGSDAQYCVMNVQGDPFIDAVHARVFRDDRGRWIIRDAKTLNGLWIRVHTVALDGQSAFQLGEQRFTVTIL